MYKAVAFGLLLFLVLLLALVPYRFPTFCKRVMRYLRRKAFGPRCHAVFQEEAGDGRDRLFWFRIWSFLAIVSLGLLGLGTRFFSGDGPWLIVRTVALGVAGMGVSGFVVLAIHACSSYLSRAGVCASLGYHGFHAFWAVDPEHPPLPLRGRLAEAAKASQAMGILDVTGYEFLGKGQGLSGGLVYDVLRTMTGTPVHLLLLEPEARVLDPDHKRATVYQTLLAEMESTPSTYQRKLRATLDTIEALNEKRDPEAKITVRFYAEKPAFRAIVLGGTAFVFPWVPKENGPDLPILEIGRNGAAPSLYEGFRRHFTRLWRSAVSLEAAAHAIKPPSTAVRRRATPEAVA